MKIFKYFSPVVLLLLITSYPLDAYFAAKDQKQRQQSAQHIPTYRTAADHWQLAVDAYNIEDWKTAYEQFRVVALNYPFDEDYGNAWFYAGVAFFEAEEYEYGNKAFSNYLKFQSNPEFFEETVRYKFCIAEKFREGAKIHPLQIRGLPKFVGADDLAIDIYQDVINTMPSHELAAYSLYSKGCLQWKYLDYREAIDAFNLLIRRFPKHELVPDAYLSILNVYYDLALIEFQNPDILAFSELTLSRFESSFPRDERLENAKVALLRIKEVYARGLFATGMFYERTGKTSASIIYYQNAILRFPETKSSYYCRKRLDIISPDALAQVQNKQKIESNSVEDELFDAQDFDIDDFLPDSHI